MSEFLDYDLPPHLIAQEPCAERDRSRLLVVDRNAAALTHRHFHDLPDLLAPGDLLVLNDTRVVPARLLGRRTRTGGRWEGLFLRTAPDGAWEMLSQTRGRLLEGETIDVEPGPLRLRLLRRTPERHWLAVPELTAGESADVFALLQRHGQIPLPPYVRKGRGADADVERYQTVFARTPGAVAAPTAGLHFTPQLLEALERRGIHRAFVTLHVGLGTFQPIQVDDYRQHPMHTEWGELPASTADRAERLPVRPATASSRSAPRPCASWRRWPAPARCALVRRHEPLHSSALFLPRGGCAGDELPPAADEPAASGGRFRRR